MTCLKYLQRWWEVEGPSFRTANSIFGIAIFQLTKIHYSNVFSAANIRK